MLEAVEIPDEIDEDVDGLIGVLSNRSDDDVPVCDDEDFQTA